MPTISEFLGITIRMYYRDHDEAHFHAYYGGAEASIRLRDLAVIGGALPPRVLGLVAEWATRYRTELETDWDRARDQLPLLRIPGID